MSPDLSRRLGLALGQHVNSPRERVRVVAAAVKVDTWDQLPPSVQQLVEDIESR